MKISLIGFILSDLRIKNKLAKILADNDQPVPADIALDYLIQEYVKLRLGGTSKVVGESRFPRREFELTNPNTSAINSYIAAAVKGHKALASVTAAEGEALLKGETSEIAEWLHQQGATGATGMLYRRAAELLRRQTPPLVAVSVDERLPKCLPDDGDDPSVWWFYPSLGWELGSRERHDFIPYPTHWLPFHALPYPMNREA